MCTCWNAVSVFCSKKRKLPNERSYRQLSLQTHLIQRNTNAPSLSHKQSLLFSRAKKAEVGLVLLEFLPMWNLGTASIVLVDNGAGWPQLVLFQLLLHLLTPSWVCSLFQIEPNGQPLWKNTDFSVLELYGCSFLGSPLPHPDIDWWKYTMYTNDNLLCRVLSCHNCTQW